jgi:hypothetical protein
MYPSARPLAVCCALLLLCGTAAASTTWHAYNDGGSDPGELISTAQIPLGSGPLTQLISYDGGQNADLFKIYIPDPQQFTATRSGSFTVDLYLFNSTGGGVVASGTSTSVSLDGQLLPGPGVYYLGTARSPYLPVSSGGAIWNYPPSVGSAPSGPGAAGTLTGWSGVTHHAFEVYTINMTGAHYVPEPGSLVLVAMGAAGAAGWYIVRRRRTRGFDS